MTNIEKSKKENSTRIPQDFESAALDFERSKSNELKQSRKLAWTIALIATAITSVSICAFLVALLTRTEPEPTILKVDQSTGATTVLRSVKDVHDQYDEVMNEHWLKQYIIACKSYDWYTIAEDFEACKLFSSDDVAKEHSREVNAPNAPLAVLKDKGKIVTKITSITFLGEVAQVRYTSEKLSTSGENLDNSPKQKMIATIAFQYKPRRMTKQQQLINPLGFQVASSRYDPEVIK